MVKDALWFHWCTICMKSCLKSVIITKFAQLCLICLTESLCSLTIFIYSTILIFKNIWFYEQIYGGKILIERVFWTILSFSLDLEFLYVNQLCNTFTGEFSVISFEYSFSARNILVFLKFTCTFFVRREPNWGKLWNCLVHLLIFAFFSNFIFMKDQKVSTRVVQFF